MCYSEGKHKVFIWKKKFKKSIAQHANKAVKKLSIPYLATTAGLLLKKQDFEQVYSSCPGLVPLPYL